MRRFQFFASLLWVGFIGAPGCDKKPPAPVVVDEGGASKNAHTPPAGKPLDQLIAALKQKSVERRAAAVQEFAQFEPDGVIPPLLEALADKGFTEGASVLGESNSTREAAVLALQKLGMAGDKALADKGLQTLTAGLADNVAGVREHSALAIGLLGPRGKAATDAVTKLVGDEKESVRRAAYDCLQKIGGAKPQSLLALLSQGGNAAVRYDAARALNAIRPLPKDLIPGLSGLLQKPIVDKDAEEEALIRMEAAEALASFGKDAEPAIPGLMKVLMATTEEEFSKFRPRTGDDPNAVRNDESPAMAALRQIGKPAVPALVQALDSDKAFVRWQAAHVLAVIGPDAKEALPAVQAAFTKEFERKDASFAVVATTALAQVQLGGDPKEPVDKVAEILKSDNAELRYDTMRVLARFGRKAAGAVPAIIPMLDDPQEAIRAQAADTLRAIGLGAKAAIPVLGKKLADENPEVRRAAAVTLKAMGPVAAGTTPALAKLLGDSDEGVRRDAIEAIMAIGPEAKAAVPDLAKLLKNASRSERLLVFQALAVIGRDANSAAADLLPYLSDRDVETRFEAIKAIGQLGSASPEVVSGLAERLRKETQRGRFAAARALATLGPSAKTAAPDLKQLGASQDPSAKVWAAVALYRLGVEADANVQFVIAALKNKQPAGKAARLAAIDAADLLGPRAKEVLPELIDSLNDKTPISATDKTPVRQRAIIALGKMGATARDAVRKLTPLLKESDPILKREVLEALGRIGPAADFASARLREIVRTEPGYAEAAQEALDRIEKK